MKYLKILFLLIPIVAIAESGQFIQKKAKVNNNIHTYYQLLPQNYSEYRKINLTYFFPTENNNGDDFIRSLSLENFANKNNTAIIVWEGRNRKWDNSDLDWLNRIHNYIIDTLNVNKEKINIISHYKSNSVVFNFICDNKNNIQSWVHIGKMNSNIECDIKNINILNILENKNNSIIPTILENNNCKLNGSRTTSFGAINNTSCNNNNYNLYTINNLDNKWPNSKDEYNKQMYADDLDFNTLERIESFLF